MNLEDRKEGEVLIIKPIEKRLDASVAVDFKEKVAELIKSGNELIVLDLSEVNFMDSSGLGAIVSSLKTLGRKGELVISGIQETVMQLFKLTRMDRVFRIFKDEKEAVSALSE
jgi:anti-sigma B factor antagonist